MVLYEFTNLYCGKVCSYVGHLEKTFYVDQFEFAVMRLKNNARVLCSTRDIVNWEPSQKLTMGDWL